MKFKTRRLRLVEAIQFNEGMTIFELKKFLNCPYEVQTKPTDNTQVEIVWIQNRGSEIKVDHTDWIVYQDETGYLSIEDGAFQKLYEPIYRDASWKSSIPNCS